MSQNATPPREPTEEMQRAGVEAMFDRSGDLKWRELAKIARRGWRAMYDAWQPLEPPAPPPREVTPAEHATLQKALFRSATRLDAAEPSSVDALVARLEKEAGHDDVEMGFAGGMLREAAAMLRDYAVKLMELKRINAEYYDKWKTAEAAAVAPDARDAIHEYCAARAAVDNDKSAPAVRRLGKAVAGLFAIDAAIAEQGSAK